MKTPLAILANAAVRRDPQLPQLVAEQIALAQEQVDYHLARSRAAAAVTTLGTSCPVKPVLQALIRVMERLYADKKLTATLSGYRVRPGISR